MVRRAFWLWFLLALPLSAGPASDLARAIRENSLDRDACYRVRDLTLVKEDIHIYFTDGYLMFGKPVAGRRITAVFTAEVANGDGEVLLLPPSLAERRSLASYAGAPNLDEHIQAGVFYFTGEVYGDLMAQISGNPGNRKAPEIGALLEEKWTSVVRDVGEGYDTRLTLDLLNRSAAKPDLLAALMQGRKLGNFEVVYDPTDPDQIAAGQVVQRNGRSFFDIWSHFPSRSARSGKPPQRANWGLKDFRIQATVEPDLNLTAVTRVKVNPTAATAAVPFEIAQAMTVSQVLVDGKPAEVLQRETEQASVGRGENSLFLVAPPEPLSPGIDHEFEFHHAGKIIATIGDRVFTVIARGNWYPYFGFQAANFDLTFRYPHDLELVTPGDVIEDRTEGEWRITRRRPAAPIGLAGFNLGDYAHARVERDGYVVDVCANRSLEPALQPRVLLPAPVPTVTLGRRGPRTSPLEIPPTPVPADPLSRLNSLANDVASALEFMASKFGPPTLPHLTVSPIPGSFGQGFPGLIYLSTRSYVSPQTARLNQPDALFFDDLLQAHETAHQWWGGLVYSAGYRDDWLMEALANYSALLYLEKTKGPHELETLLENYRVALLAKSQNGQTVDAAGPIVLGTRLESSLEPNAWRVITYGKGSWILQMLRQRMGDGPFFAMLAQLGKRFGRRQLSTEDFRLLAAEFLPAKSDDSKLEGFFDQWVYGTGIPTLKLTYALKGKAPALRLVGTLSQSDVGEDFSVLTPVEIQMPRGPAITHWVRSSSEPVSFTVALRQAPVKVTLDPHEAVLRR